MKKEYQWKWIIEQCDTCHKELGQTPVADEVGEDCELYDELKRMKEEDWRCPCGGKIIYKIGE